MKSKINLHVHTNHSSDGGTAVSELVPKLKDAGIEYFAITDHDILDANVEAAGYAEKYRMKHFNGIELSCRFSNGEIGFDALCGCHILGLGVKLDEMQKRLKILREEETNNLQALYELLVADGYKLELDNANPIRRSMIRDELIARGYATDKKDCNTNILCKNAYLQYVNYIDVQSAIKTIKECGGLAIWAHPFNALGFGRKKELTEQQISELLDLLCRYGLDGIEVYYQKYAGYTAEQIMFLESLANSKKMIKSIGTDYHGTGNERDRLFFSFEGIIPDEAIISFLENRCR